MVRIASSSGTVTFQCEPPPVGGKHDQPNPPQSRSMSRMVQSPAGFRRIRVSSLSVLVMNIDTAYGIKFQDCRISEISPSNGLQGFLDGLRPARTLFPMAQRVDAEPEPARELFLRHVQTCPDRLHVDLRRDVDAIVALVRLSLGIGHRFPKATPDTVGNLAHGFLLLNLATSNVVSCRKSLRSCWLKIGLLVLGVFGSASTPTPLLRTHRSRSR